MMRRGEHIRLSASSLGSRGRCILACLISMGCCAVAQDSVSTGPSFRHSAPALPDSQRVGLPRDAYEDDPAVGIPVRSLFRNTQQVPLPNPQSVTPEPSFQTESFSESIHLLAPSLNEHFPLSRGFAPQNADLKLGPVYFKFRQLGTALYFSDNIDLKPDHRESGVVSQVVLGGTLTVQLTEDFHFVASGALVYLPLRGAFGLQGAAAHIPLTLGVTAAPQAHAQASWNTVVLGVPILFADDFSTLIGHYSEGTRDDFTYLPDQSGEQDRQGHLVFRTPSTHSNDNSDTLDRQSEFLVYRNRVSAHTSNDLPGDLRLTTSLYHENYWYGENGEGNPSELDGFQLRLQELGENVRFKPYLDYLAIHSSETDGVNHTVILGVTGPITDQLFLRLHGGYFYGAESGSNLIFGLNLIHDAGPSTRESLYVGRGTNYFQDELETAGTYFISQVWGPKLRSVAFVSLGEVEDLRGEHSTRDEVRTGLDLYCNLGPRTVLDVGGFYTHITHSQLASDSTTSTWTGRAEITYHLTDTLVTRLAYRYQKEDAESARDRYYENLLYFSIIKYFR